GKEAILHAIGALCTACHKSISIEDPATPNAMLSAVSSACTKKLKTYREAAYSCLQEVIKAFRNPGFFGIVFPYYLRCVLKQAPPNLGKHLWGLTLVIQKTKKKKFLLHLIKF
ncbi:hypothetical protein MKX01_013525, partial [Papaver californicum]